MARIGRGSVRTVVALALLPAGAFASAPALASTTPTTQTTPAQTTPTTPVKPVRPVKPRPPAKGKLRIGLSGIFHVRGRVVTVTGRAIRVNGFVAPFVPGQLVTIHAFIGHDLVHSSRVRVWPSPSGRFGRFSLRFIIPRPGHIQISAVHSPSSKLERLVSHADAASLTAGAGFGSTGPFVQLIQSRLALLHFYIPQTGVYDGGTGWAIDAYHRLRGWGTSQNLDGATIAGLLAGDGTFHLRFAGQGKHVEGNLSKQLLALAYGGHVYQIYPISSGKPSTPTVLGTFSVYLKTPSYLPDGMYFSSFFYGGYAIHGFDPAPDYPASHGCMRVPIPDAVPIYNWLQIGNNVDVYY